MSSPSDDLKIQILESEIAQLHRQIEQFDMQVLQIDVQKELANVKLKALMRERDAALGQSHLLDDVSGETRPLEGMGFREAVLAVLEKSDFGLQFREIADAMNEGGFEYRAATDFRTRLSNEL